LVALIRSVIGPMCLARGHVLHHHAKTPHTQSTIASTTLLWQAATAIVGTVAVGYEIGESRLVWCTAALALALFAALSSAPTACSAIRRATRSVTRRVSGARDRTSQTCLTTIHGRSYDLSSFVASHPGGPTAILLAHGTDATAMFESYHPLSHLPAAVLARYEVGNNTLGSTKGKGVSSRSNGGGSASAAAAASVDGTDSGGDSSDGGSAESDESSPSTVLGWSTPRGRAADPVYDVMRERVAALFDARGRGTKATTSRLAYYSLTIALWAVLLRGYLLGSWVALPLYTLCAWHVAGIGHDAAHFEVSTEPLVNSVLACCIGTISNPLQWYYQHTVGHHSHTNDPDKDPDLHHYDPFLRVHEYLARQSWHKWQHLIVWPFMTLFTFGQALWQPLVQMQLGEHWSVNGITPILMQGRLRVAVLSHGMLGLYVTLHLFLPLCWHPSLLRAALFFLSFVGGTGGLFGLSSAINHLTPASAAVEATPVRNADSGTAASTATSVATSALQHMQQQSWAARQAVSSNNFCVDSPLAFWLSNALNYQVEHHLFPGINHEHLPTISPVVRATCAEFGVPYNSFPSWTAIASEFNEHMRQLGADEDIAEHAAKVD